VSAHDIPRDSTQVDRITGIENRCGGRATVCFSNCGGFDVLVPFSFRRHYSHRDAQAQRHGRGTT